MPRPTRARSSCVAAALLLLAGAGAIAAGTNRFTRAGGPDGGAVSLLAIGPGAPGRLLAATASSGLFLTVDGAASWTVVNGTIDDHAGSGLDIDPSWAQGQISALAADPVHFGTYFAASQAALFETENGGLTWIPVGLGGNVTSIRFSLSAPANVYAVASTGLWRSRNSGATWQTVVSRRPLYLTSLTVDPASPEILYAAAQGQGAVRSLDGGVHWRPFLPQSVIGDERAVESVQVDATVTPRRFYAATGDGLFLSRDGGTSWTAATSGPAPGAGFVAVLALDPAASGTVYAVTRLNDSQLSTPGVLWKSTDAGSTWTPLSPTGTVGALVVDPGAAGHLYAGTLDDGVLETLDGGATWRPASHGLAATYLSALLVDPLSPGTLYVSAEGGSHALGAFRSTDRGATWTVRNDGLGSPPPRASNLVADPRNAGTFYLTTFGQGLFKTTDSAATWQAIDTGLPFVTVSDVAIDPGDSRTVYAVGYPAYDPSSSSLVSGAARSTDGGATWTQLAGLPTDAYFTTVAIDPLHAETIYIGGDYSIFRSDDHGATWMQIASPYNNPLGRLFPDPATGALYAVTLNNGLFKSLDRGVTWLNIDNLDDFHEVGAFSMALLPGEPNTLYAAGYNAVLVSTDGGDGYIPLDPAFTGVMRFVAVEPRPLGTVYTTPYNGGSVFSYTPGPSACTASASVVCLSGRFKVGAIWHDYQGGSGPSVARPLSDLAGAFRLNGPDDDELIVKILDARVFDLGYLVIFNGLGANYSLRIEDTATGRLRGYAQADPKGRLDVFPAGTSSASAARSAWRSAAAADTTAVGRSTASGPCVASDTTLCFFANRFRAEVAWTTPDRTTGSGHPFPIHLSDGGGFWFFAADNPELTLQIQDFRKDIGHFWLSYAGLSTVDYTLTVTDTQTGIQKAYHHRAGRLANAIDTETF